MTNRDTFIIAPDADTAPRIDKSYTYVVLNNDRTITLSDTPDTKATSTTTSDIIDLATSNRSLVSPVSCVFTDDRLPFAENAYEFLNTYGKKTGGDEMTTFYSFNACEYAVLCDNTVMTIDEYNSIADADVADT